MKEIVALTGYANTNSLGVQMDRMKKAGWELPKRRPSWRNENQYRPPTVEPKTHREVNSRFGYAIRQGKIKRAEACERCGRVGRVDGHHHDYSKPFEVEWLCRECHVEEHRVRVGA